MEKRTEQQWTALFDAAVISIIGGRCANDYFGDFSIGSIVSEAIRGADLLIKELKEGEGGRMTMPPSSPVENVFKNFCVQIMAIINP